MKMSDTRIDSAAVQAEDGIWQDDLPELGDLRVKVRGLNNRQYRLKFEAMVRALPPSKRKNGAVDPIERDRIIGVCMLETVLQDWQNLEDWPDPAKPGEGVEGLQPYSKDRARVYLTNPDYQKIRDGIFVAASRVGEMIEEDAKETEKN